MLGTIALKVINVYAEIFGFISWSSDTMDIQDLKAIMFIVVVTKMTDWGLV